MIATHWFGYVFLVVFSLNLLNTVSSKSIVFNDNGIRHKTEFENEIYNTDTNLHNEASINEMTLMERMSKRRLNFDDVNDLLEGVSVTLPDLETRQDLGGFLGSVLVRIKSLTCGEFKIGNVALSHEVSSMRRIPITIDVSGIDIVFLNFFFGFVYQFESNI